MILATHVAYALALSGFVGLETGACVYLAVGSVLPDIDYPRSFVGKLLPFIAVPVGKKWGHRQVAHGYPLWFLITLGGFFWKPLSFIGLGGISHIFLDCHNVAGVQALKPFSEKRLVNFKREWRMYTGSSGDLVLCLIFTAIFFAGLQIRNLGGVQMALGNALGSYSIVFERYLLQETRVCYLRGNLRFTSGKTVEGRWLIVGKESEQGLALWNNELAQVIHIPREAEFLRVELETTAEHWQHFVQTGFEPLDCGAFAWDLRSNRWRYHPSGEFASGQMIRRGACPEQNHQKGKIQIDYGKMEEVVKDSH